MTRTLILLASVLAISASAAPSTLILFDTDSLGPAFVQALELDRLERGSVSVIAIYSGKRKVILNKAIVELLSLPDLSKNRTSDQDFVEITDFIKGLETRKAKYPQTSRVISSVQLRYQAFLQAHENNLVFLEGEWRSKDSIAQAMAAKSNAQVILKLKDGSSRTVKRVMSLSDEGVNVMTEAGITKILFADLDPESAKALGYDPEKQKSHEQIKPQTDSALPNIGFQNSAGKIIRPDNTKQEEPTEIVSESIWVPSSLNDVAKCVVIIKGDSGSGTGFICNEGNRSFIYTNAHVLAGNKTIQITNRDGIVVEDIVGFEVSNEPFGGKSSFSSGDLARIHLSKFRNEGLRFAEIGSERIEGTEIAAIGNSDGANVIVTLKGEIAGVGPDTLEISSEIIPGNSGGPVVDSETFAVVGVATFLKGGTASIWAKNTRFEDIRRFALRTDKTITWKNVPIFDFLRECYLVESLKTDVRLLGLLGVLDFRADGIFYDEDLSVEGEYLVGDIIDENIEHPLVRGLLDLNKALKSDPTGGDNVFLNYVKHLSDGGRAMAENRTKIDKIELSWFNRNRIDLLDIVEVHDSKMERFPKLVIALREYL